MKNFSSRPRAARLAALALSLSFALSACGTAALGSEPTVESDPIVASGEDAVSVAVAADKARSVDFTNITPDGTARTPADMEPKNAAIRAQSIFDAFGLAAGDTPWMVRYFSADEAADYGTNSGRSFYDCSYPLDEEHNFICRLDGITGRLIHCIVEGATIHMADQAPSDAARTFSTLYYGTLGEDVSAEDLEAMQSSYLAARPDAEAWLENDAAGYVQTLTKAVGLEGDWQYNGVTLPEAFPGPDSMAAMNFNATINGQGYSLQVDPFLRVAYWILPDSSADHLETQADAALQAAQSAAGTGGADVSGWYNQAEDGTWYYVTPDGTQDDMPQPTGGPVDMPQADAKAVK